MPAILPSHGEKTQCAGRSNMRLSRGSRAVVITTKQVVNDDLHPIARDPPSETSVCLLLHSGKDLLRRATTSNGASCISGVRHSNTELARTPHPIPRSRSFVGADNLRGINYANVHSPWGGSAVSGITAGATSITSVLVTGTPEGPEGYSSSPYNR